MQRLGAKKCAERAGRILDWLGLDAAERCEHWQHWCEEFLTKEGKPRAPSRFASKAVTDAHPDLARRFLDECDRIIAAIDACLALQVAAVSAALMTLAAPVLRAYAEHKDASGLLDYDDLIGRTSNLLVDPGAAWVLYKLDGGLDHLLLDEVQDTAPEQWRIAHALTAEFFAGATARATRTAPCSPSATASSRSIRSRAPMSTPSTSRTGCCASAWTRRASPGGTRRWTCRSAPRGRCWNWWIVCSPIRPRRPVWSMPGDTLTHYADRADHAGAVELWPLAPLPDAEEPEPWTVPEQNRGLTSAPQHSGGDAGAMDRARGRRRRDAGEQGPAARPWRRDGAGASQERLRPRAGARAEVAAACRWPGWTG